MDLAVSDFFESLSFDIEWIAKEFTYADELQDKAIEKKRQEEMIFAIFTAILLTLSAITGVVALFATPMTAGISSAVASMAGGAAVALGTKLGKSAQRLSKGVQKGLKHMELQGKTKAGDEYGEKWADQIANLNSVVGGIVTGGFIGITGFVKEANNINHGDDIEGFDKFLALFKHLVSGFSDQAHHEIQENMVTLVKGEKIAGELDFLDLFKSGFYSSADVDLRGFISSTMTKVFTARIIGSLWHDEGVHIVESRTEGNITCEQDTRGPAVTRVCLSERPGHTYNLQAITHWDDEKIYEPPGLKHLMAAGGYKGVTKEDVVRSSLFQYEVWRTQHSDEQPSIETILQEAAKAPKKQKRGLLEYGLNALVRNSRHTDSASSELVARANLSGYAIPTLEHYGEVPAAINLPICYSWFGQAMSGIIDDSKSNAPCLCDAPDPSLASRWEQPNNWTIGYTHQFILEGEFYRMKEYGEMCRKGHDCVGDQKWKQVLGLPADEEVPKEMEDAWDVCLDTNEPGGGAHHSGTASQLTTKTVTKQNKVIVTMGTKVTTIYTIPSDSPRVISTWVPHTRFIEHPITSTEDGKVVVKMWRAPIVEEYFEGVTVNYPPQPTIT